MKPSPWAKILLKGSCHCGGVKFRVYSAHIFPYQRCYCGICRKTQGGGGYAINLSADARTLKIQGKRNLRIYRAKVKPRGSRRAHSSTGQRHFCKLCGSALWLFDPEWPELVHPFASAIDTPLPLAPESTHLMLNYKAPWVIPQTTRKDKKFGEYSKESIAEWHDRMGLTNRRRVSPKTAP